MPCSGQQQQLHGIARRERDAQIIVEWDRQHLHDGGGERPDQEHFPGQVPEGRHIGRPSEARHEATERPLQRLLEETMPSIGASDERAERISQHGEPERGRGDGLRQDLDGEQRREQQVGGIEQTQLLLRGKYFASLIMSFITRTIVVTFIPLSAVKRAKLHLRVATSLI